MLAERVADLVADDRGEEARRRARPQMLSRTCPVDGEEPGGEEERVAGEEEADEQPGLGEDDQEQPDRPEGPQELLRVDESVMLARTIGTG